MTRRAHLPLTVLVSLLTVLGCDPQDEEILPDDELELRLAATPMPYFEAYHGLWTGPMEQTGGDPQYSYEATIMLAPGLCTVSGEDRYLAQWSYEQLDVTCTSELELVGTSIGLGGARTWTFYDANIDGPCEDGYVDLTETDDPTVMDHKWRWLDGTVDATGVVTRVGMCGSVSSPL